ARADHPDRHRAAPEAHRDQRPAEVREGRFFPPHTRQPSDQREDPEAADDQHVADRDRRVDAVVRSRGRAHPHDLDLDASSMTSPSAGRSRWAYDRRASRPQWNRTATASDELNVGVGSSSRYHAWKHQVSPGWMELPSTSSRKETEPSAL